MVGMVGMVKKGDNWKAHMTALAYKAIEQLQGTCKSEADCGEEIEDAFNDTTFCSVIDDNIFCCDE